MPKIKAKKKGEMITIRGVKYKIIYTQMMTLEGKKKQYLGLQRPNGTKGYFAFRDSKGGTTTVTGV